MSGVRGVGTGSLLLAVLAACAPPYSPRVAQYQNIVLDARELGAEQVDIEMQRDSHDAGLRGPQRKT